MDWSLPQERFGTSIDGWAEADGSGNLLVLHTLAALYCTQLSGGVTSSDSQCFDSSRHVAAPRVSMRGWSTLYTFRILSKFSNLVDSVLEQRQSKTPLGGIGTSRHGSIDGNRWPRFTHSKGSQCLRPSSRSGAKAYCLHAVEDVDRNPRMSTGDCCDWHSIHVTPKFSESTADSADWRRLTKLTPCKAWRSLESCILLSTYCSLSTPSPPGHLQLLK